jgi:hypothetical protein
VKEPKRPPGGRNATRPLDDTSRTEFIPTRSVGISMNVTKVAASVPTKSVVHPLRQAVNLAETALKGARYALAEAEELSGVDTTPLEEAVGVAEEGLDAARKALIGSDCPRAWQVREGYMYQTITASSPEAAVECARENVDRANYADCTGTLWISVQVTCEETGEEESDTVTLDEDAPDCESGEEHDWQSPHSLVGGLTENPGVHGHGGGVLITEVCSHCGCKRVTDTWAQNSQTGEQGLHSVTYEADAYSEEELAEAFPSEDAE